MQMSVVFVAVTAADPVGKIATTAAVFAETVVGYAAVVVVAAADASGSPSSESNPYGCNGQRLVVQVPPVVQAGLGAEPHSSPLSVTVPQNGFVAANV